MDNLTAVLLNNYINGGGGSGGGLPPGGTDGQIIRKDTSAQEGAVWQDVDAAPTENSTNLVESGGVASALGVKINVAQGTENASKVLTVGADGNVSPQNPSEFNAAYSVLKKVIVGYSLTAAEPADWATNYTNYYTNTGTADDPVYTAVTGETAPTWEEDTYYSYSAEGVNFVSITIPSCSSIGIKADIAAATAQATLRCMTAFSDVGQIAKRLHDLYLSNAIKTSSQTTIIYLTAGRVIPMAFYKIGSGAWTTTNGALFGSMTLPRAANMREIYFTPGTTGVVIPAGTAIEIRGAKL